MEQTELNFDLALPFAEMSVFRCLKAGRQAAVSSQEIARETRLTDREIRICIRNLIMEHGILVASAASSPKGFYLPVTQDELVEATKSLRHRGISILVRAAKLQRASLRMVFQQALLEMEGEGA